MRLHDVIDRARCAGLAGAVSAALCVALTPFAAPAAAAEPPSFRFEAPLVVERPAPFVELALPVEAYARSRLGPDGLGLRDLRIVDAGGERVPFAWLAPRAAEPATNESARAAPLFALPARPAADGTWRAPIDVAIDGERVRVRRLAPNAADADGAARPGGWVFDLGARTTSEPAPDRLRLAWSGPREFSAAFDIASSDDLRTWRAGGAGQVLALQPAGAGAALTQPDVVLGAGTGRFVRLVWADASTAPALTAAQAVTTTRRAVGGDAPSELSVAALPPAVPAPDPKTDPDAARALVFDLGGTLPIVDLALQWTAGTHVAPLRVQGRQRADEPWRELGAAVFYRLDRAGTAAVSPPWPLPARARYLRFVPDERAGALDAAGVRLVLHAELARLVFASQGTPPYRLQVGSAEAAPAALPIGALVPALGDERARFGRASAGAWSEVADAARRDDARAREAALRPWLLWAVLLAGVGVLAFMVWRLTRPPRAA